MTLKKFLEEQADALQSRSSEAQLKLDEWLEAIDHLNKQIEDWIAEADTNRILKIERVVCSPIREEGIGTYSAHGLVIKLGPREVRVEPVARFVAGPMATTGAVHVIRAFGRVDMTNGLERYMIFRTAKGPDGPWTVVKQDRYQMQGFDQQSFEAALQDLLG